MHLRRNVPATSSHASMEGVLTTDVYLLVVGSHLPYSIIFQSSFWCDSEVTVDVFLSASGFPRLKGGGSDRAHLLRA